MLGKEEDSDGTAGGSLLGVEVPLRQDGSIAFRRIQGSPDYLSVSDGAESEIELDFSD